MTISIHEIKEAAIKFSKEWENEDYENGESKSFLDDFFSVFGINRRRVATFEKRVKKLDGKDGFIDLIWKGVILIEMKSRGKSLDRAYNQATEYFDGLTESDLPQYIMVSDFENIRLYDLDNNKNWTFKTKELYKKVNLFSFLYGYKTVEYKESDPVNIKAAEKMGKIHDTLKDYGYDGHYLELYLVRLLFCLFADNTSIFNRNIFYEYIVSSNADGCDLSMKLSRLFEVLNTPRDKRMKNLSDDLQQFPYVNGGLFAEIIPTPEFTSKIRETLIEVSKLDWGIISPAIFGSMFQSVMNPKERRRLGAHYTSELNIKKVIRPLFLDKLWEEFEKCKSNKKKLNEFHIKLSNLKFLDPACGCGNFLIIAYKELRELELEVLSILIGNQRVVDVSLMVRVNINQFYGIEFEEFSGLIAKTAMWLIEHQMNMKVSEQFGQYFIKLPLIDEAHIYCGHTLGNALTIDWSTICPKNELNYIMGNPPFIGFSYMSDIQKKEMLMLFPQNKNFDYVTGWYKKAAEYIQDTDIDCAFVSTNSICQGECVAPLWGILLKKYKININFAYTSFNWKNEAKGNAAVHCVIIGFSINSQKEKNIYSLDYCNEKTRIIRAKNINPYLFDGENIFIKSRNTPLCNVPKMIYGNKPADGGNLIIEAGEYQDFIKEHEESQKYIKKLVGATEFINNTKRYVLWLVGANPKDLRTMSNIMNRVQNVKTFRENSKSATIRKFAETPTLFCQITQPQDVDYLLIPRVSTSKRKYIPIGFKNKDTIVTDAVQIIPNADLYHFGILTSNMHMIWMKTVGGRLKSDYRYGKDTVYNTFPWPLSTDYQKSKIRKAAKEILTARNLYPNSTLADLYDPLLMPIELVQAHDKLDKLVEKTYGKTFTTDSDRISYLFRLYCNLTNNPKLN